MKFKLSMLSGLLFSTSALAVNPPQGVYFGLMGTISSGPTEYQFEFTRVDNNTVYNASVENSRISGGGGGAIGYRIQNFRIEGELFYNWVSGSPLTINQCVLESPNVLTPTGNCPAFVINDSLGFRAHTTGLFGFINGYHDFIVYGTEKYFAPYIGFGIGMVKLQNSFKFVNSTTGAIVSDGTISHSGPAGQAIFGLGYFLDDFTQAFIDYRDVTTGQIKAITSKAEHLIVLDNTEFVANNINIGSVRYSLNTINIGVNFLFDGGCNNIDK